MGTSVSHRSPLINPVSVYSSIALASNYKALKMVSGIIYLSALLGRLIKAADNFLVGIIPNMKRSNNSPTTIIIMSVLVASVTILDTVTGYDIKATPVYILVALYIMWKGTSIIHFTLVVVMTGLWTAIEFHDAPNEHTDNYVTIINMSMNILAIVVVSISMLAFHRAAKMALAANTDPLTEIFSRRYIYDIMPVIIGELKRHNRSMAIMFIDCDNFKKVNDEFGHAAGDAVLRVVAKTIMETIRVGDIPVRLGGDEFIVIFREISGIKLTHVVQRCVEALNNEMNCREWPITFSVGVVEFNIPPENIDDAINYGDQLMYQAKREGKNRVIYDRATLTTESSTAFRT